MPDKDNNILKYNPGEKSMNVPFIICSDLECLPDNISTCHNDPEKTSTTKINKHTHSGYSLFTHCSFGTTKNSKPDSYRDCTENLCKTLKKTSRNNNLLGKKEMMSLTDEEKKSYENQKRCYICKKRFIKDSKKVRDHCHFTGKSRGVAHNKCNMNYEITKDILFVFHNGSTYDYHFIIKEIVKEFKGKFEHCTNKSRNESTNNILITNMQKEYSDNLK